MLFVVIFFKLVLIELEFICIELNNSLISSRTDSFNLVLLLGYLFVRIPIISDDVNDNNGERIYRDIGYVTKEVTKLALLLHRFETEYNDGNIKFEKLNHPIPAWAL